MRTILSLFILLFGVLNTTTAQNQFYYHKGQKIELEPTGKHFMVHTKSAEALVRVANTKKSNGVSTISLAKSSNAAVIELERPNLRRTEILSSLGLKESDVNYISPAYKQLDDGFIFGSGTVVFQLRDGVPLAKVNKVLAKLDNINLVEKYGNYSFEVNDVNKAFKISNQLYELGFVNYAHPDFYVQVEQYSDPLYEDQFYLNNTGQRVDNVNSRFNIDIDAPEAWAIIDNASTVNPVTVAVIDDGLLEHEDLNDENGDSRFIAGTTPAASKFNDPNIIFDDDGETLPNDFTPHGLACAGIIAASHNDVGIRGIAPHAKLISANTFVDVSSLANDNNVDYDFTRLSIFVEAFDFAVKNGADVINCSWGFSGVAGNLPSIEFAIDDAIERGRDRKGCVVVFAAGNEGNRLRIGYPARYEKVIAVGAVTSTGTRALYSNFAKLGDIDLVAPSSDNIQITGFRAKVRTLDAEGDAGYNNGGSVGFPNYHLKFGGTSASAPMVSGVAALMLSLEPNLSFDQVKTILYETAKDVAGTGTGFDKETGYGIVSAGNALNFLLGNDLSCTNGIQDGDEEGVDCGGSKCSPCPVTPCSSEETELILTIKFDQYPEDIFWSILNDENEEVASGDGYTLAQADSENTIMEQICLVDDCYTFIINDRTTDGLRGGFYNLAQGAKILAEGEGDFTQQSSDFCIPDVVITPDQEAPSMPTNLVISDITQTSANLSWDPSTDNIGVNTYFVNLDQLNIGSSANTNFILPNLNPDQEYSVEIIALDEAGNRSGALVGTFRTLEPVIGGTEEVFAHFFEEGWDGWIDGGTDAIRRNDRRAPEGDWSIRLRDNSGEASSMTSQNYDLSLYESLELSFSFYPYSMDTGEDFLLEFDDGSGFKEVASYVSGTQFRNNRVFKVTQTLSESDFNFTSTSRFRFRCDASTNGDQVFIDEVVLLGNFPGLQAPTTSYTIEERTQLSIPFEVAQAFGEEGVSVLPNPTTELINIRSEDSMTQLSLYSVDGRLLIERAVKDPFRDQLSVSHLPKGVYLLKVQAGEELITEKIIKQ